MQNPPPDQPGNENAKTALGLDANLGAALGYPIGIIALIVFIIEKENRFARFHALQSLLYHAAWIVVFIVLVILFTILALIAAAISESLVALFGVLGTLLWLLVVLVYFATLILAAIKAYGGKSFKMPIVGNIAEKFVNK